MLWPLHYLLNKPQFPRWQISLSSHSHPCKWIKKNILLLESISNTSNVYLDKTLSCLTEVHSVKHMSLQMLKQDLPQRRGIPNLQVRRIKNKMNRFQVFFPTNLRCYQKGPLVYWQPTGCICQMAWTRKFFREGIWFYLFLDTSIWHASRMLYPSYSGMHHFPATDPPTDPEGFSPTLFLNQNLGWCVPSHTPLDPDSGFEIRL